ncbi:unnamed protein product [Echinostoma caproni]|uniref:RabBD domain-containing protein n=1 Tax=Echinostoma caproni TaxID=27848 RepID=A0A183ALP3_9TREM|nr:unnamed protein product [Echinostoma caproni]
MTSVPRSRGLSQSDTNSGPGLAPTSHQPKQQQQLHPSVGGVGATGVRHTSPSATAAATGANDSPDLSHLTPEERRIIEEVLQRQKHEEQIDAQVLQPRDLLAAENADCGLVHRCYVD